MLDGPLIQDQRLAVAVAGKELPAEAGGGAALSGVYGGAAAEPEALLQPYLHVRGHVVAATLIIAALAGTIAAWSVFAPLATGAIASGVISVESNRKVVQHLEGGIIRALKVQEGTAVQAGDPLILLDDTRARSAAGVIRGQVLAAAAKEARLIAQRDGLDHIWFPDAVLGQAGNAAVAEIIAANQQTFASQRAVLEDKRQIYARQIRQLQEEIASLTVQIAAYTEQRDLIALERQDVAALVQQGLERRPRLLALQRSAAGLTGQIEGNQALIARAHQRIAEIGLQITDLEDTFRSTVAEDLHGVQEQLIELRERAGATEDALARTVIVAPQDGIVVDLRYVTIGGVIPAGEPILDLVPVGDDLIIVAQVDPLDRENLHPGLPAHVVLSSLNRRTTPILNGELVTISADRLEDPRTGRGFYQARVRISHAELAKLSGVRLYPGMPAEVKIVTGERSAIQYLTTPFADTLRHALVHE